MSYPIALNISDDGVDFILNNNKQTEDIYGWTITKSHQLEQVFDPELSSLSMSGRFSVSLREHESMSLILAFKIDEKYMNNEIMARRLIPMLKYGDGRLLETYGLRSQLFFYVVGECSSQCIVQGLRSICPMQSEWTKLLTDII